MREEETKRRRMRIWRRIRRGGEEVEEKEEDK